MSTLLSPAPGADRFPAAAASADELRALLGYAVLAPSSHNAQPCQFEIVGDRLHIFADRSRWLRVARGARRGSWVRG